MSNQDVIVYAYTDENAVQDGVLVPLSDTNRVTSAVFVHLQDTATSKEVPRNWPLVGHAQAMYPYTQHKPEWRAYALAQALAEHYGVKAKEVWDAGEVWAAALDGDLKLRPGSKDGEYTLWLLPNELGGVTLMFPEDC